MKKFRVQPKKQAQGQEADNKQKLELFKFQRPLFTSARSPMMLVYNEDRSFLQETPITEVFHGFFDRHGEKFYAAATVTKDNIHVDERDILKQHPLW